MYVWGLLTALFPLVWWVFLCSYLEVEGWYLSLADQERGLGHCEYLT